MAEGNGALAKEGERVVVHYEARWKGVTFMTSRWCTPTFSNMQGSGAVHSMLIVSVRATGKGWVSQVSSEILLLVIAHIALWCHAAHGRIHPGAMHAVHVGRCHLARAAHLHQVLWSSTGGTPLGFDVGAKGAGSTLAGLDLVCGFPRAISSYCPDTAMLCRSITCLQTSNMPQRTCKQTHCYCYARA